MMTSRLIKFWDSLRKCKKGSVRFLFNLVYNDKRTLTGKSVSRIAEDCQVEKASLNLRHTLTLKYYPPPQGEMWRLPFLQELLDIRKGRAYVAGVRNEEIEHLINDICVN